MGLFYGASLLLAALAGALWLRPGLGQAPAEGRPPPAPPPPPAPAPAPAPARLPDHFRPTYYRISLTPFLWERNWTAAGEMRVWLNCSRPGPARLTLHAHQLALDWASAELSLLPAGAADGAEAGAEPVPLAGHSEAPARQTATLLLPTAPQPGARYRLRMRYTAQLSDQLQGFYRSSYTDRVTGETRWLASTQFSPTDARRAFPCWDEPAFKARWELSVTRPPQLASLSNLPLASSEPAEEPAGWWRDRYPPTLPMSSYLVALVVSDLQPGAAAAAAAAAGPQFRVWARRDAAAQTEYAARVGPRALAYLEDYFHVPFPLPKQDMVALPDFGFNAMENWGLITFRETAMLFDANSSTEESRANIASITCHEIAHQWFGNLVTPHWWSDLWLKEGFATYIGSLALTHVEPHWREEEVFAARVVRPVMRRDALSSTHPISVAVDSAEQIRQMFDSISYDKGASVIRMMGHFLGAATLRAGLANYLRAHALATAQQDDLWAALTAQAHADGALPPDLSVKQVMDTWTLQAGLPEVRVVRDYAGGTAGLTQSRLLLSGGEAEGARARWWVPVSWAADAAGLNSTRPRLWLRPEPGAAELRGLPGADRWLLVNVRQTGFYRVNYDDRNWELLAAALPSLPPSSRAQLVSDSLELARAGRLSYGPALQLAARLAADTDYLPWAAAAESLGYLRSMLAFSPAYGNFRTVTLRLMEQLYSSLDFDERPGDSHIDRLNRAQALAAACRLGHEQCVWHARAKYRQWMAQESRGAAASPISPGQRATVYCTALRHGGGEEWDFAWAQYLRSAVSSHREELLTALGCSGQPWLLNRYLERLLATDSGVRKQDGARVFLSVATNEMGHSLAFNFLRSNWEDIQDYYGAAFSTVSKMVGSLSTYMNTARQLEELESFRKENADNLGTTEQSFEQTIQSVKANIEWMERSYAEVDEWFKDKANVQAR